MVRCGAQYTHVSFDYHIHRCRTPDICPSCDHAPFTTRDMPVLLCFCAHPLSTLLFSTLLADSSQIRSHACQPIISRMFPLVQIISIFSTCPPSSSGDTLECIVRACNAKYTNCNRTELPGPRHILQLTFIIIENLRDALHLHLYRSNDL